MGTMSPARGRVCPQQPRHKPQRVGWCCPPAMGRSSRPAQSCLQKIDKEVYSGLVKELCLRFVPTTRFPVAGCLRTRGWARCTSNGPISGTSECHRALLGTEPPSSVPAAPGRAQTSLPRRERNPQPRNLPSPPHFSPAHTLWFWSWGDEGLVVSPPHPALGRGQQGTGPILHPTPLVPAPQGASCPFAEFPGGREAPLRPSRLPLS